MGVFGNKKKSSDLPPLPVAEMETVPTYDQVLDYLTGLSDAEYGKVCEVADIYRKANQEAAAALGVANEPYTFITPPEEPEEDLGFLLDEELARETKKSKIKDNKVIINKKKR